MKQLRRIATGSLMLLALAGLASADTIVSVANFGPTSTDVGFGDTAMSLTNFQSTAGWQAGDVLQSVQILMTITETVTDLSFVNVSDPQTDQNFNYETTAQFFLNGTAQAADLNNLKSQLPSQNILFSIGEAGGATQTILSGETLTYVPGPPDSTPVSGDIDTSIIGKASADLGNPGGAVCGGTVNEDVNPCVVNLSTFALNLTPYDTTGTFDLSYSTATGSTFFTGGGNVRQTQKTQTSGTYEVIYTFQAPGDAPEPASMFLMGGGLLGLAFLGKRFRRS